MSASHEHAPRERLEVETDHRAGYRPHDIFKPHIPGLPGLPGDPPPTSPGPTFPVPPTQPGDLL